MVTSASRPGSSYKPAVIDDPVEPPLTADDKVQQPVGQFFLRQIGGQVRDRFPEHQIDQVGHGFGARVALDPVDEAVEIIGPAWAKILQHRIDDFPVNHGRKGFGSMGHEQGNGGFFQDVAGDAAEDQLTHAAVGVGPHDQ